MRTLHNIASVDQCWLTKDGQLIPFVNLTNEHIHNIIWAYKIKPRWGLTERPRYWKHSKARVRMLEGVYDEHRRRRLAKLFR